MSNKEIEDKRKKNTDTDVEAPQHKKTVITCPVCGKPLGDDNLPDVVGVIEERLCSAEDVRIVNSEVILECDFHHYRDEEEGVAMEDQHSLVSVIKTMFDSSGKCIAFDIVAVRPAE